MTTAPQGMQGPVDAPPIDYSKTAPDAHPAAHSLATFFDNVNAAGMGAVDPNVLVALGQGATKAPALIKPVLHAVAGAVKAAEIPFTAVFHEASQHIAPSIGNYFSSAMNGTNNHLSAMTPDILSTQKQLQAAGFGTDLQANGVWSMGAADSQWSNAFIQWSQAKMMKPGIGATSAKGTMQRVVHDIDPRYSLPALWRGIVSMVPATQRLIAHTAGSVVDTLAMQNKQGTTPTLGSKISYALEPGTKAGLSNVTDAQAMQEKSQMYGLPSLVGDAGTAINLYFAHGLLGSMGGTVARAGVEALDAGGGNIAKGAVTSLGAQASERNTVNMMNALVLKPLSGTAKVLAGLGKVGAMVISPREAIDNLPNLKYIYPYIDSMRAGADGAWQSLRSNLRIPYRFPLVRGIAPLYPKAVFAGGVEQELARTEKAAGDTSNPLVMSMDHLTPIAGDVGKGLLAAQFLLHSGYDEAGKVAQFVGKGFNKLYEKVGNAVSDQSGYSQWERGTGASFEKTNQALIDAQLPASTLTTSVSQQMRQAAVRYAAGIELDRANALLKTPMTTGDMLKFYQDKMNAIWDDPAALQKAQDDFSLVKNGFQAHVAQSRVTAAKKDIVSPSQGIVNHELAKEQGRIILKDARNLDTPDSRNALGNVDTADNFQPTLHNFGIAKKTTLTSDELGAMVDKAVKETTNQDDLHAKLIDIAFNKLGVSTATLVGKDAGQIEDYLYAQAHLLPANVYAPHPAFNIQQELAPFAQSALEKLDGLGYKMVYGTHIGHDLVDPVVPLPSVGLKEALHSTILSNLGLSLTKTSDSIYGQLRNSGMLNYLQKYFDKGAFAFPPGFGPSQTMQLLHTRIDKTMTPMEKWFGKWGTMHMDNPAFKAVARALSAGRFDEAISKMMETDNISRDKAKLRVQELLTQQKSSKDWTQKQVVDVLTAPYLKDAKGNLDEKLAASLGVPADQPFTDEASAIKFYRLMQEGSRKMPVRLQGIGKFTDLLDNQFGLAGLPMGMTGQRLPNLTGTAKRELLKFRYPINLQFAWKRVVKTQLKGASLGITPSANPGLAMKAAGTYENDMNLLRHYKPEEFSNNKNLDDALREAEQADLYNVFNPQEIQARNLGILYRRAMSDPANRIDTVTPTFTKGEPFAKGQPAMVTDKSFVQTGQNVSSKLTPEAEKQMLKDMSSVYDYGDRSALERSTNAIFFPFSFEKTVMRQLGVHLLDNQGQIYLAGAAMDFYDSHNGPEAKKWAEDNLPLIKQIESFYPYSNGLTLGAFGGIQKVMADPFLRATLALFSPKVVAGPTSTQAVKALLAAIPMFKQANQMFGGYDPTGKTPTQPGGDLLTTAKTSIWYLNSKYNSFVNHSSQGVLDPHPEQPYKVQLNNGFNLQSQLVSLYADELKANHSGRDFHFPDKMPYVGRVGDLPPQKITMNAIKTIVQSVYPLWDKNKGLELAAVAADKTAALQRDIARTNPELLSDYQWFVKNSDWVVKELQADKLNSDKVAGYTQQLRAKAVELAALDRDFAAFYKKYYQNKFGPLEAIR